MRLASALLTAWRVYATVAGLAGIAALFAAGLALLSAGQDPVIVVDGPPQGAFIRADSAYGRDRLRLRIKAGEPLVFDSMWHTAKGGCERIVTSTLSREGDGPEAFTLTQQRRGEFFPVGQPGRHPIRRDIPAGLASGVYRYRAKGEAVCPTRRLPAVEYADFDVEIYDPDGPVVVPLAGPVLVADAVSVGGPLAYRISYRRLEAGRSEVLNTFTSVGWTPSGTPDVVLERRPTAGLGVGEHRDIDIATSLPRDVHPGRWRLQQVIITERPGRPARYDPQFSVEFEVRP